jgi:hypothetical protein
MPGGETTGRVPLEEITAWLFDFPPEDLAAVGRALSVVTARAPRSAGRAAGVHRSDLMPGTPNDDPSPGRYCSQTPAADWPSRFLGLRTAGQMPEFYLD